MGERRFIILLLILFLNFLGIVYRVFERTGDRFYTHFALMAFFGIIGLVVLLGILGDRPWTYQIGMLLFAALLVYVILLYFGIGRFWTFIGLSIINLFAFLVCVGSLESYEERKWRMQEGEEVAPPVVEDPKVEVYEERSVASKSASAPKKKSSRKSKAKKK
ncbi:MAG: hypothetical protein QF632_01940 [Candidatus Woesearchaeota archaeon]|nr:hypothetical protein [Candidatus Woesearchaeota archaeon]MDP7458184.1 hypothetical protein [Candidatus Woesearchaeota archaeon]